MRLLTDWFFPRDREALGGMERKIAKRLDVETRGLVDGQRNYPSAGSDEEAPCEQDIRHVCQTHADTLRGVIAKAAKDNSEVQHQTELLPEDVAFSAPLDGAAHEAAVLKEQRRQVLTADAKNEQGQAEALAIFRHVNGRHTDARIIESLMWKVWLILWPLFAEPIVNAVAYSNVTPNGVLGGWAIALVIGGVNWLASALNGFFPCRNLHHRKPWRRLLGGVGLGTYAVFLVLLAGFAAHYADAAGVDPDSASSTALTMLWQHPLTLHGVAGFWIFVIQILLGAFVSYECYALEDTYPRYAKQTHEYLAARRQYDAAKDGMCNSITTIRDAGMKHIDVMLGKVEEKVNRSIASLTSLMHEIGVYTRSAEALARIHDRLISRYRMANRAARSEPPPKTFAEKTALKIELGAPVDALVPMKETRKAQLRAAKEQAGAAKGLMADWCEEELRALPRYFTEIEAAAAKERFRGSRPSLPAPTMLPEATP